MTPFDQPFSTSKFNGPSKQSFTAIMLMSRPTLDDPSKLTSIHGTNLKTVQKHSMLNCRWALFNTTEYAHISAVLFNSCATWGKVRALSEDPFPYILSRQFDPIPPRVIASHSGLEADYDETLFDGLRVYHNPHATHPLDWRVFQEPGAYQAVCRKPRNT